MTHAVRAVGRLLVVLGLAAGCTASRAVAPLAAGQHGLTASFGGPFVEFAGAPVPVPFFQLGYRYGIDGHTDIHAAVHVTGAATSGVGGFDVGAARELLTADGGRPRIMVDLNTSWFYGDVRPGEPAGGFRFFPELALVFTWDLPARDGRRPHRIYVGLDNFFEAAPTFSYILTPLFGTEIRLHRAVGLQIEAQWHAPWVDTTPVAPVWYGPGNRGVVGVKLALDVYLPTKDERAAARARRNGGAR
ncbi:MAG: hypothetical protein H6733_00770 [Alphaproteobacteria bacterium]|nr:hypothetical protein [Alphaproteobacteria bacterium]